MRALTVIVFVFGCAGSQGPAPASELAPPVTKADTPPFLAAADMDAVARKGPHPDAAAELRQYGQLEGVWMCRSENRQPDGSWKAQTAESRWTFFYALGGHAVQDVFVSPPELGGGVGTNLRIYDPETRRWLMTWTTSGTKAFDTFEARYVDGTIVMSGELPARAPFPAHQARITFHDLTPTAFSWKYEGGKIGGTQFQEFARLGCRRDGEPASLATPAEIAEWATVDATAKPADTSK